MAVIYALAYLEGRSRPPSRDRRLSLAQTDAKGNGFKVEREKVNAMAVTRDSRHTVAERVKRDPAFAKALLDEALTLFLNGEPDTARLVIRDLVNSTVGFEQLAIATGKPVKSLHRMLSTKGNPSMENLSVIVGVLRKRLRVKLATRAVKAA
jgi:DNA-binding phage protein